MSEPFTEAPEQPEDLPEDLRARIEALSEQGNQLMDDDQFSAALEAWREAYQLLPAPRDERSAALWLHASIAEALYMMGDFPGARNAMREALGAPGGAENPYVHYMLGKALWQLDDEDAVDALLKAYLLDGVDIFDTDEDEGLDVLQVLQDRGLIDD